MTVSNQKRSIRYQGNDSATEFDYDFFIEEASHVEVIIYNSTDETYTPLTVIQYSITGLNDPGFGAVTYPLTGDPLSTDEYIIINRVVPYVQVMDILPQGGFHPNVVEAAMDRTTRQIQQIAEIQSRSLVVVEGEQFQKPLPLRSLLVDRVLAFDENGDPTPGPTAAEVGNAQGYALAAADAQTAAEAASDAALAVVPNYFSTTRAVLKGYDTAIITAAYLKEAGREGQFLWNSADLSGTLITATVLSTAVDATLDIVTKAAHGLYTGQAVYPTTTVNGLTAETFYYVIRVDANSFKLASSYEDAIDGTAFDLTGTTNFTVKRYIDPTEAMYVIPNGAARDGSEGAWIRQRDDLNVSVLWCGADTALTDNSAAFAAAANLFGTTRIDVPAGDFLFTKTVTWLSKSIVWRGSGRDVSRLIWSGDLDGFSAGTVVNPIEHLEVFDLSFLTSVQASTTTAAIRAEFTSDYRPACTFERLILSGTWSPPSQGVTWWGVGIRTNNAMNPTFRDIIGRGATGTTVADVARADALIYCTATVASVVMIFDNIFTINFGSCVKIRSSSTPSMEGVYMDRINAVFSNTGIDVVYTSGSYKPPQIYVHNSQFECFYRNIDIRGASEVDLGGNLFYFTNFGNTGPNNVYLENCVTGRVYSNTMENRPTNTTVEGIRLHDCDSIDVFNNTIEAQGTQIAFTGTTQNCTERANRCLGTGTAFADVSSNAATNKGGRQIGAPGYEWSPEGCLVQWGRAGTNTDGSGDITVNFARSFNNLHSLVVSNIGGPAGTEAPFVMAYNTTGFMVRFPGAASVAREYSYIARGN